MQIQKGGKVLLWNQVKSRMEACYSELVLIDCEPTVPKDHNKAQKGIIRFQ